MTRALALAVVDDEPTVRRALARLLRAAGHGVEVFDSCAALIVAIEAASPDCIIVDLHMPGISGLELLEGLQELRLRAPIIVVTAHEEAESQARALRAGAAAYLRKPLDGAVLLDAIAKAIVGRECAPSA